MDIDQLILSTSRISDRQTKLVVANGFKLLHEEIERLKAEVDRLKRTPLQRGMGAISRIAERTKVVGFEEIARQYEENA